MTIYTLKDRALARFFGALTIFMMVVALVPAQTVLAQGGPQGGAEQEEPNEQVEQNLFTFASNSNNNASNNNSNDPQIKICHANNHGYDNGKKEVDEDSIIRSHGHGAHDDGGYNNQGDIIPPFDVDGNPFPYSKNWEEPFISIWENGCDFEGSITVEKVIVGNPDVKVNDFNLFVTEGDDEEKVQSGKAKSFAAGTFVVSEEPKNNTPTNYTAAFSGDCNQNGVIELAVAKHATCTITNTYEENVPTTGVLVVIKDVVSGNADADDFTIKVFNAGDVEIESDLGSETGVVYVLPSGAYTVEEVASSSYAVAYTGACASSGSVTVTAGATSTCTVLNRFVEQGEGTLIIEKKVTQGSGTTTSFTFDPSWSVNDFNLLPGESEQFVLASGTYSVTEKAKAGWSLKSAVCTYEDQSTSTAASVALVSGQTVTCTFTNDEDGDNGGGGPPQTGVLEIIKVVVGTTTNPSAFSFDVDKIGTQVGDQNDVSFESDGTNAYEYTTGVFTVTENIASGFTTTYSNSFNSDADCEFLLVTPNATTTCTITNTYNGGGNNGGGAPQTGVLRIVKIVQGSTTNASNFTFNVDKIGTVVGDLTDIPFESDGSNAYDYTTGVFTVTENVAPGFTTTYSNSFNSDADCEFLLVTPNATTTCVITNTAINGGGDDDDDNGGGSPQTGVLRIIKLVVGTTTSASAFSFNLDRVGTVVGDLANVAFESDGSNVYNYTTGLFTITENVASGYTTTYGNSFNGDADCEMLLVTPNATTTCTIINTFVGGGGNGDDEDNGGNDNGGNNGGGGGNGQRIELSSGGGTRGGNDDDTDSGPTAQVLGEQTSIYPYGAPNTGSGGGAYLASDGAITLLYVLLVLAVLHRLRSSSQ